jgi:hypothetical protein
MAARCAAVLLCGGLCLTVAHCGTDAVGIDACRQIEQLRCELVAGCPTSPVQDQQDIDDCKMFYRDQCLHGIADGASPDGAMVDACLGAIRQARACWNEGLTLAACQTLAEDGGVVGPTPAAGVDPATSGCGAIMAPEMLEACSFLRPAGESSEQPPADAGNG